jgi:hypothetical protein
LKPSGLLAFAVLGLTTFGACNDQIHLGTTSPIYWSADFETGDLSQWSEGGATAGGDVLTSDGQLTVVTAPTAHSGRFAARSAISASGNISYARLYRWGQLPQDAYFSVWMLIQQRYTIAKYWNVFEFQARTNPADPATLQYPWSLNLERRTDSELYWYLFDGQRQQRIEPAIAQTAPIGRWFQVEAFMHQAPDSTGRVTFSIDGTLFADVGGVSTVPSAWLSWVVGGVSPNITEQPAELFLDDAVIARTSQGK